MIDLEKAYIAIKKRVEVIAVILMCHEDKDFCLAQVAPQSWRFVSYKIEQNVENYFVIVPSPAFCRFILNREYLKIVDLHPECFGQNDDRLIVRALKEYDKHKLIREYTDEEFLEYLRGETMAYVLRWKKTVLFLIEYSDLICVEALMKAISFKGEYFMSSNILPLKDIQPYQVIEKSFR